MKVEGRFLHVREVVLQNGGEIGGGHEWYLGHWHFWKIKSLNFFFFFLEYLMLSQE